MNFVSERRIGKFHIAPELINSEPYRVLSVLSAVLVVRAEAIFGGPVEYLGFSPYFDPLKVGEAPPTYRVVVTDSKSGGGTVSIVHFEREA